MSEFRKSVVLLVILLGCVLQAADKPNVLIILADDLGYGDLGCYEGKARTPHLDDLASKGVRFTDWYSGAPNCSPARVSLMTGRMPVRSGMYSYRAPGQVMHLPDGEITLAEILKGAGYQTAHVGKWHLSCLPQDESLNQPQPADQGFEYSLGTENNAEPSHLNPVNFVRNGTEIGMQEGYACQLLADEVELWFNSEYDEEQPFFLYLPFHEPHAKVASPPEMVANYPDEDKKSAEYYANIENLDDAIGRVLAGLRERGLLENTMVFFGSDNGSYRFDSNGVLRGKKGEVYDGGIKVPGIFYFEGKFEGNRVLDTPAWLPDMLPTVCELVGLEPPSDRRLDGVSLLEELRGSGEVDREQALLWYFYRSSPEASMRFGKYSLVARADDPVRRTHPMSDLDMPFAKAVKPEFFELYDLDADPGQREDLAKAMPEKLEELKKRFWILFEESRAEGPDWVGLPEYGSMKANHDKVKEFLRNEKRFVE
ncbi:MAG: sulfatase-like hydrolase/transferase [Verrucomicrobiota bacterium]